MNTRRELIRAATTVGIGVLVNPTALSREPELRMTARIFFDSYNTLALRQALNYAGDDGFVASLPQLLRARVNAGYDNIIWNTWFSAYSEESVVTTPGGSPVVVTVHGGGIFGNPGEDRACATRRPESPQRPRPDRTVRSENHPAGGARPVARPAAGRFGVSPP